MFEQKTIQFTKCFRRYFSVSPRSQAIGFIGLGNTGKGMAANLVSKGHSLIVYDVNQQAVSELGRFQILNYRVKSFKFLVLSSYIVLGLNVKFKILFSVSKGAVAASNPMEVSIK